MVGLDDSVDDIGVIPSAISWLYQLIDQQKRLTAARFSVRVSAVELTGRQQTLTDLLANCHAQRNTLLIQTIAYFTPLKNLPVSKAGLTTPCFRKKTPTHIIGYKLRNSCLILIIFDTKISLII